MFSSGCGPGNDPNDPGYPPNQAIIDPPVVFDNAGNFITAYQNNDGDGPFTYIQKTSTDGSIVWKKMLDDRLPEPQTLRDKRPSFTELVSDGQGNTIITWNYQNQIFAKKLDTNGQPVWEEERIKIGDCNVHLDRQTLFNPNGTTVVWKSPFEKLYLQTIDDNGNCLLPDNTCIENVVDFDTVCDDRGNTWIIWGLSDGAIHLIKVNSRGQYAWQQATQLGREIFNPARGLRFKELSYWILNDGTDGVIAGWANNHEVQSINLFKIDSAGNMLWKVDKKYVGKTDGMKYRVIGDSQGGIFVYWDFSYSTFGQHINSDGKAEWGDNGVTITAEYGEGMINADSDQSGGSIILWKSLGPKGYTFLAQRIDRNGIKLWDKNGDNIAIGDPFSAYMNTYYHAVRHNPMVVYDGIDSFLISYAGLSSESFIQKINKDGTLPWGLGGIRLGRQ